MNIPSADQRGGLDLGGPRPDAAQHLQSKVKFNETAAAEPELTADWNAVPVAGPSPQHHTTSYLFISATRGVKTDDLFCFVSQYFCAENYMSLKQLCMVPSLSLDCEIKSKFVCDARLEMPICNICMYQIRTTTTIGADREYVLTQIESENQSW